MYMWRDPVGRLQLTVYPEDVLRFLKKFKKLPRHFFGQNMSREVTFDDFLAFIASRLKLVPNCWHELGHETVLKIKQVWDDNQA